MKKIFLTLLIVLVSAKGIIAANLDASVRMESHKTGLNPLPILVLIKTSSVATETNLKIVVSNGWSVSSSVTVSTVGLPNGVNPLPSISNGVGVGQEINFVVSDLNPGTQYGFYLESGINNNPAVGNNTWTVSTNFDSMKVNVPVVSNDSVTVTGKVMALASDFQIGVVADKNSDLSVDEVVTYTITYGSYLLNSTKPLVLTGSWTRGTVSGSPTPSVDIVDYVVGSGTVGYGGVGPVIDLLHNKITWTINSFPPNMIGQTVSFQLRVNHSYTGQSRVRFDVEALLSGANVVTTNSMVTSYYLPASLPTATITLAPTQAQSTPTNSPSQSNDNGQSNSSIPTSTPTIVSAPTKINKIEIVKVSDSEIGVAVESSGQTPELKILFGTSSSSMVKTITSINNLKADLLNLDGLFPDTVYFFKIQIKDNSGKIISSDIYTFRTASASTGPYADNNSMVVSVNNNVVLDASEENNVVNSVVIAPSQNYAFRINLKKSELVKNVRVLVRSSQVLGITSVYGAEPNSASVDLEEIVNGGFVGHLVSPIIPGYYDVVLRIEDKNGGISEDKIGVLRVIDYLKVKNDKSKPIENAMIVLNKFDFEKKIYKLMSPQSLGFLNPSYTEADGTLKLSLPNGKYRVDVSALGYENKQQEFSIGLGEAEVLPEVTLVSKPISLANLGKYYMNTGSDVGLYLGRGLKNLLESTRFFNLVGLSTLISTLFIIWSLASDSLFDIWQQWRSRVGNFTWGKVIDDENNRQIAGATIYLLDGKLNKVLNKVVTNTWGRFRMELVGSKSNYRLAVTKDGYDATPMEEISGKGLAMGGLILKMENIVTPVEKVEIRLSNIFLKTGKSIFLGWLLLLLIFELLFWSRVGWNYSGIWVVLSWLNLIGWLKL